MSLHDMFSQGAYTSDETDTIMSSVRDRLGSIPDSYRSLSIDPIYMSDTLFNIKRMFGVGQLDVQTKHLIAVAVAAATHNETLTVTMAGEARAAGIPDPHIIESLSVAAAITSSNIFHKFQHLIGPGYTNFKPQMRLSVLTRPTVLKMIQVELICAIVSVVNDCHHCVRSHVAKCRELSATEAQIEEALRVGAIVSGMSVFESS